MPDSKISALPSGIPAQAGDQFPIARSGLNYSLTPVTLSSAFTNLGAWQAVQTSSFTAVVGKAYPIDTTSAAITVTLPDSATRGDVIYLADYAGTFATNNLTIQPNFYGYKLNGSYAAGVVSTNRAALQLVYSDATQGWLCYTDTIANLFTEQFTIQGLVVAGGGGSPYAYAFAGGGGGGGGFRTYLATYPLSPSPGTIETGTVTVGAGGTTSGTGASGADSVLNTITSAGGGKGGDQFASGIPGGSGGGGGQTSPAGGAGNTPATNPSQGYPGSPGSPGPSMTGAGGGAGAAAVTIGPSNIVWGMGAVSPLLGIYTSSTSVAIGTGSKTFTVATSLNFVAGENVNVSYNSSNYMLCTITSYNSGTGSLVVNCIRAVGSGTYTAWTIGRMYASGGNSRFGEADLGAGANTGNGRRGEPPNGQSAGSGIVLISVPNTASVTFSGGVTSTMSTVGTRKVYKVTATSTTSETYTVTVP